MNQRSGGRSAPVAALCQRRLRRSQTAATTWCLGILVVGLLSQTVSAQQYTIDWHTLAGGGGGSSGGGTSALNRTVAPPGQATSTADWDPNTWHKGTSCKGEELEPMVFGVGTVAG